MTVRAKQPNAGSTGREHSVPAESQPGVLQLSLDDWADLSRSAGIICDAAGVMLAATRNTRALFNLSAADLIGTRLRDLWPGVPPLADLLDKGPAERTLDGSPEVPPLRIRGCCCGGDTGLLGLGPDQYLLLVDVGSPVPLACQDFQRTAGTVIHQLNNMLTVLLCRRDLLQEMNAAAVSESRWIGDSIQLLSQTAEQIKRLVQTVQDCEARLEEAGHT